MAEDFADFVLNDFGAKSLDLEGDVERRPDFIRDSLLIELKSLEVSPQDKIETLFEPDKQSPDWPIAYGMLNEKHFKNSEILKQRERQLRNKIQKSVRDHMKKANKQIRDYGAIHLHQYSGILVLLNEDIFELSPEMVMHAVQTELKSSEQEERTPYDSINAVVYITEAHYFPISTPPFAANYLSELLVGETEPSFSLGAELIDAWARRSSSPALEVFRGDGTQGTGQINIVPEKMAKSDLWRHEYRKAPHLASYSRKKLAMLFCKHMMLSLLTMHKNSPGHCKRDLQGEMRRFTEVLEEMTRQGLDMREITLTNSVQRRSLAQLNATDEEKAWLRANFVFRAEGNTYRQAD
ncbi:hypothetical protein KPG71_11660 [Roseovarius sp. PS-C2]|uniref:hypothetical protein n=1 Tax=Roseovarius sp. PS-C2 TaxID=2820814 RepID=UPI001C0BA3E2|nr:hypothetical protein [Roseovarius sp. PS-C2]MBU3260673.1 hypothetical protein [Roseovarius sp. PS-C2]